MPDHIVPNEDWSDCRDAAIAIRDQVSQARAPSFNWTIIGAIAGVPQQ